MLTVKNTSNGGRAPKEFSDNISKFINNLFENFTVKALYDREITDSLQNY
jgi:hypothetical protein